MSQGYERLVVVLTRNRGYRKSLRKPLAARLFFRKYPHLQNVLWNRNAEYNRTMELVEKMEDEYG